MLPKNLKMNLALLTVALGYGEAQAHSPSYYEFFALACLANAAYKFNKPADKRGVVDILLGSCSVLNALAPLTPLAKLPTLLATLNLVSGFDIAWPADLPAVDPEAYDTVNGTGNTITVNSFKCQKCGRAAFSGNILTGPAKISAYCERCNPPSIDRSTSPLAKLWQMSKSLAVAPAILNALPIIITCAATYLAQKNS